MRERGRLCVCVCVCVKERESERRERAREITRGIDIEVGSDKYIENERYL